MIITNKDIVSFCKVLEKLKQNYSLKEEETEAIGIIQSFVSKLIPEVVIETKENKKKFFIF